jgi:hypothetical protein
VRLLLPLLLLAGCTWSPDPSQVPCTSDNACPPTWRCDLERSRCEEGERSDDDDAANDDDSSLDDDDVVDDDDTTPDDDDATLDDDDVVDDDDQADDDDSFNDDDDSDAAAAALDQRYCADWSTAVIADDPLQLISEEILAFPFLVHFSYLEDGYADIESHPGGASCAPSTNPDAAISDYRFFDRNWTFTPGNGQFQAGQITWVQVPAKAGLGFIYDVTMTGIYIAAENRFVEGTVVGELDITAVLATLPTITCDNAPGCHACPGVNNAFDCITLEVSGMEWAHAGDGEF